MVEEEYPDDLIGGEIVPPLVIRGNHVISGEHKGTVYVEKGKLVIDGTHNGTLNVMKSACTEINGQQHGRVNIEEDAKVTVCGAIEGTTTLEEGSILVLEEGGRVSGSLFNAGNVVIRGVFGGVINGSGEMKVEDGGQIKKPIVKDGIIFFEW